MVPGIFFPTSNGICVWFIHGLSGFFFDVTRSTCPTLLGAFVSGNHVLRGKERVEGCMGRISGSPTRRQADKSVPASLGKRKNEASSGEKET